MALQREVSFDGFVTERVDVLENGLLGEYNSEGKYMISEEIIAELVNIEKYKRNAFNNAVYCVSYSKVVGNLLFEIIFKKNKNKKEASATLSLLEQVKKANGYVVNTIKTPIGIYRTPMEPSFVDNACKSFNTILDIGQGYENINSEKLDKQLFIEAKKTLTKLVKDASSEDYDKLYENYFNERMELLNKMDNPFTKEILARFGSEKEKIKEFFLKNKEMKYKALNELLDMVMEWCFGIDPENKKYEEEYRKKILPMMRAFMLQASVIQKTARIEAERHFPKNKKAVLDKTLANTRKVEADKTKEPPKVIDKSPIVEKVVEAPAPKVEEKKEEKEVTTQKSLNELFEKFKKESSATSDREKKGTPSAGSSRLADEPKTYGGKSVINESDESKKEPTLKPEEEPTLKPEEEPTLNPRRI